MQLKQLTIQCGSSVIRTVTFKPGLNLILDKPTHEMTESGNNVGKTTVLRLIDFCLGSDGDDIWQDPEFKKNVNQDVYNLLHGDPATTVELTLISREGKGSVLSRTFNPKKNASIAFKVDGRIYKTLTEYRSAVRFILFCANGGKPTLRQLAPKFVRSSPMAMARTLKFLGEYARDSDYEALHLFLFGFFAVDVLEERPRLLNRRKILTRDLQALTRNRNEGEIEQLLIHLKREIESLSISPHMRGEVPEIAAHADRVSKIRSDAANFTASLGQIEAEINTIQLAIVELQSEYADIDDRAIERIYKEAQRYIPSLHRDWNELTDFIQNLRGRKERFLKTQIGDLEERAISYRKELAKLEASERTEIGALMESTAFNKALEVRADLQNKLKRLGSLEQDLADIYDIKDQIEVVEKSIAGTKEKIDQGKAKLRDNVATFNGYFSKLSKDLYGEEYLLHFDENSQGSIAFHLSSVGSNVGSGKKTSQTAAFDLAYIEFLRKEKMPFPTFVCHDGLESIHGNQLKALLFAADKLDGQLIVATLRDKLPAMPDSFIEDNTVLELSQDDKLFGL